MSANPMGMDVYILTDDGEGGNVEYKKYESISVETAFGVYKAPVKSLDMGMDDTELDRKGEYFKKLSYMLYSAAGSRFLSIAIAVEVATQEEYSAYHDIQIGKKPEGEFEPFKRSAELPNRAASREEKALSLFFAAANEAVKMDGYVDMRVYPPVARNDFNA